MDLNPSKTLMCCGGDDPSDLVVFSLPDLLPLYVIHGHTDWIFASKFVSDSVLATGAKDNKVSLWRVDTDPRKDSSSSGMSIRCGPCGDVVEVLQTPIASCQEHTDKIRCMEYSSESNQLYSLGSDATVRQWDLNKGTGYGLTSVRVQQLDDDQDLVAMGLSDEHHLVAVGASEGTTLYDMRAEDAFVCHIPTLDRDCGVRCLTFNKDLLAIGGGGGSVAFWDLRVNDLRPCPGKELHAMLFHWYERRLIELVGFFRP